MKSLAIMHPTFSYLPSSALSACEFDKFHSFSQLAFRKVRLVMQGMEVYLKTNKNKKKKKNKTKKKKISIRQVKNRDCICAHEAAGLEEIFNEFRFRLIVFHSMLLSFKLQGRKYLSLSFTRSISK